MKIKEIQKLEKKNIETIFSLTPMQEGMLFHYLGNPGEDFYFEQLSLELLGKIDTGLFERAWNFVIESNETLRAVFRWENVENPIQITLKKYTIQPGYFDLSEMEPGAREIDLEKIKAQSRKQLFDLRNVSFRLMLCKIDPEKYVMIVENHHILYDGWSTGIILKEFFTVYNDLYNRKKLVKPLKTGFKEFVKWMNDQRKGEGKEEQFWKEYLQGFSAQVELSTKQKRKEKQAGYSKKTRVLFEKDRKAGLEEFAEAHKVTLSTILYSAWGIVLQRYNDSRDVIFGSTVSGRTAKIQGVEEIVGLFINTLPLRVRAYPGESIIELLDEIHNEMSQREDYESSSLVEIKKYSEVNTEELFDTIVVIENYPMDVRLMVENSVIKAGAYTMIETPHYDLTVGISIGSEIDLKVIYDMERIKEESIERLIDHFKVIVEDIVKNPGKPVEEIEMLLEEEKRLLLYDFNKKEIEYPKDKTIHGLFENQVEQTPDQIAIVYSFVQITYRELNEKSNRLAFSLQERGVRRGNIVGIQVERSIEMIVGILGILKSGCAYMPINPKNPEERTRYMMEDSGAKVLINCELLMNDVGDRHACPVSRSSLPTFFQESTVAYIIYTSGSTGKPKGVPISHTNISPLLHWGYRNLGIGMKDRVINNLAYYFDWSVWEIFITLTTGAGLHIVSNEMLLDVRASIDRIRTLGITVLHVTPTQYGYFVNEKMKIESLKYLFIGAEKLTHDLVERSIESVTNDCRVFNMYGPTEATIISTVLEIRRSDVEGYKELSSVPIGRAVGNLDLLILGKNQNLSPIGVIGELYISGDGVARGYLNNPQLTADRFISGQACLSPTRNTNSLYCTGDLVKWLEDGNIEYIGRIDQQVKIRGFRIELGEIETQILRYDNVKEVVVAVREGQDSDRYLCAYVAPLAPGKLDISQLRRYLGQKLPVYMAPAYFIEIDKIPLNPNGKVDIKALPLPGPVLKNKDKKTGPRNEMEKKLIEIWKDVLGSQAPIGVDDSFFEIGGHSLKATRLASKIHKEFNVITPLQEIFISPTICGMAEYIETAVKKVYSSIEIAEKKEYYECSSAQKRLYILQQKDKNSTAYNMSRALELEGDIQENRMEEVFNRLIERHESLRTSIEMIEGEPVQRIHDNVDFNITNHPLTKVFGPTFFQKGRFELSKAPLMRVGLIEVEEKKRILIVEIHHIVSDGVSTGIIIRDFIAMYKGEMLIPLTLQYKDYLEWQNRLWVKKPGIKQKQEEYWLKRFEGEIPVLSLPTDYIRPVAQGFEGSEVHFELEREPAAALDALAKEENTTLFMILMTVFDILVMKLSGQEEIVIGTVSAGRRHSDLDHTVGMFVNTLALRSNPCGEKTYLDLLKEVEATTLEGFENQDYPFEELVENVVKTRDLSRNPLFDVMFVLQNLDIPTIEIPGLTLTPIEYETGISKFDMTFINEKREDALYFTVEYSTKLYRKETIERFTGYFKKLVLTVLEEPVKKISDLEIIAEEEKRRVTYDFNKTGVEYPKDKTVHGLETGPRDETEKKLLEIWMDVLGNNVSIGIDDNFFEIGGHSLKATQLAYKIQKILSVNIPLADVFSNPSIRRLADYIRGASGNIYTSIEPVEEREYYPLSSSQQRLYFLNRWEGIGISYNMPSIFEVDGKLEKERLEYALKALIQRHSILRTSFPLVNGEPVQHAHEKIQFEIEYEYSLNRAIENFIQPFDLTHPPLLRVRLVEKEKEKYILMFDMNHIISDGTSIGIFIKEFTAYYAGKGDRLTGLNIQYHDFSQWQQDSLFSGRLKTQEDYWINQFSGELPVLDLPLDFPRPSTQSFEGNHIIFEIDGPLLDRINRLNKKNGTTLYMTLLTALTIVLSYYTGQEDIIIGTPIAGRNHPDLENLIGFLLETLVMRNRVNADQSVKEFISDVKDGTLEAFENQAYPFKELIKQVAPKNDLSRNPIFDVMLLVQNFEYEPLAIEGLTFSPYPLENKSSKVDITLEAEEEKDRIRCVLEYCTTLFKKETIERFSGHFVNTLIEIVKISGNPSLKVSDIEILSEIEKRQILEEFNTPIAANSGERSIHRLFEEQVERTPDHIAIVDGRQITYRELNEKSGGVAVWLREKGVGSDIIIGIKVERSIAMMVGIFGILKAGGAYLPINPELPQERVDYMIKDSGAKIIISDHVVPPAAKNLFEKRFLDFQKLLLNETFFAQPLNFLTSQLPNFHLLPATDNRKPATSLAYIIYTSGSTGKPKGVLVEHRNVVAYIEAFFCEFHLDARDTALQQASLSFDVFVEEVYPVLFRGGKIAVARKEVIIDFHELSGFLLRHDITFISVSPLLLNEIDKMDSFGRIRICISGGDVLKKEYIRALIKRGSVYNTYGPTEATVCATYYKCSAGEQENIPIGKPITNYQVQILNENEKNLPIGVPGELCVSGGGVARGYLNLPEKTAERFINNQGLFLKKPPLDLPGIQSPAKTFVKKLSITLNTNTLYKTGDLARWLDDGNIEYIGRIDQQVKIRGYRIEPGEIETQIMSFDKVKEVVVAVRENRDGERYLCAYIVQSSSGTLEISQLKSYLERKIPLYMIPAYFMELDKLPLNPNGKVDKKALPLPGLELKSEGKDIEPRNETEKKVMEIWKEVLGSPEPMGIGANFFEIGGHSLKATRLTALIHKEFKIIMPLQEIFLSPTIRGMADYIDKVEESACAHIEFAEKKQYYRLTSAQKRMYILQQMKKDDITYHIYSVMEAEGKLDRKKIEAVFLQLIERHENFRTSFEIREGEPVQRIHDEVEFTLEESDTNIKSFIRPFDLSKAPLMRVGFMKTGEMKHILIVDMSHIISDGVSIGIFIHELMRLYSGEELSPLRLHYKDFSEWQGSVIQKEKLEAQEQYWLERYRGEIPVLELPYDFPRPPKQSLEGKSIEFEIAPEQVEALRRLVKDEDVTLFMLLIAVYSVLMSKLSWSEDIIVGIPSAGRGYEDLHQIIGMFVNTIALRSFPTGRKTFVEFLKEIKKGAVEAFDNQDYPFEDLVEKVAAKRDISRNPIFDTMFTLQNLDIPEIIIPGLKLSACEYNAPVSRFDMTWIGVEIQEALHFTIEYSVNLFKEEKIKRYIEYFREIIDKALTDRNTRIEDIGISQGFSDSGKTIYNEASGDFGF